MKMLKRFISVTLLNILVMSSSYAVQLDSESLLNSFRHNDHENIQSIDKFYDGYIRGVADVTANKQWCPPSDLKDAYLQKVVSRYYKDHEVDDEALSPLANDLIINALADAYPCSN